MSMDQSRLANAASELRTIGDRVRRNGGSFLAPFLAEQTANVVDRFGTYLEETNGNRLLADAERFARAQPWATNENENANANQNPSEFSENESKEPRFSARLDFSWTTSLRG